VDILDEHGNFKPYFPRLVESLPGPRAARIGGQSVGARQFFQKERLYDTEAEGVAAGVKYVPDLEQRLVTGIERVYRAIADNRLANDPVFGSRTRSQLVSDLRRSYPTKSADQIRKIADSVQASGAVWSPAFFGKVFSRETAALLNKEFAAQHSVIRKAIASVNSLSKALELGFDFGVGQIQLAPLAFNHPVTWAYTQYKSITSMFSQQVMAQYVRNNLEPVRQMAQLGSSVGRLQEFMVGVGKGELLSKVPVVGPVAKAFGRQFQTALDVAKVELWKAWRDVTPKEQWPKVIQSIESTLGSGRMESAMITHSRALTERVALLAPSYYRGMVNFVGALTERGVTGSVARRAFGAFTFGSLTLYYGMAKSLGMSDDEIKERLNPANSAFMMWKVQQGNQEINVGLGGVFRSFLRLIGKSINTSVEHPGNWTSLTPQKNPLVLWYRAHSGPTIAWAMDQFTGRDFLGREIGVERTPFSLMPLIAQDVFRGKNEPKATPVEYAGDVLGLQSFPAYKTNEEKLREVGGKSVTEMSLTERLNAQDKVNALPQQPRDEKLIAQRALEHTFERQERLRKLVKPETMSFLSSNGLKLPGYDPELTLFKTRLPLTSEERTKFEGILAEQYDKAIGRLMQRPDFDGLKPLHKQELLKLFLDDAREEARLLLEREMTKRARSVSP